MKIDVRKPTEKELEKRNVFSWDIWKCEPSSFDWQYSDKETCYVLEGSVTVETDNGRISFGKGDLVVFPKGLSCRWTVHEPIRKHYTFG